MYKMYRILPIGDTTRSFTWKYHYNLETAKKWSEHLGGTDSEVGLELRLKRFQAGVDKLFRLTDDPNANSQSKFRLKRGTLNFPISSIQLLRGKKKRLFLNIPNNGLLTQFPKTFAVELPVVVSKDGKMKPEHVDHFQNDLSISS